MTVVLVLGVFSATALAADNPPKSADSYDKAIAKYEKILNEFEDVHSSSFEKELYETEDNDDFSAANAINNSYAGIPVYSVLGQIDGDSYDVDTYKFSVTASGTFYILGFWFDELYDQGLETELMLELYDSKHRTISSA